jgi:hypothetical protein
MYNPDADLNEILPQRFVEALREVSESGKFRYPLCNEMLVDAQTDGYFCALESDFFVAGGEPNSFYLKEEKSASKAITQLCDGNGIHQVECSMATDIAFAKAVLDSLKIKCGEEEGEKYFDMLFGSETETVHERQKLAFVPGSHFIDAFFEYEDSPQEIPITRLAEGALRTGDLIYIQGHPDYIKKHPSQELRGFNALSYGLETVVCFSTAKSVWEIQRVREALAKGYNAFPNEWDPRFKEYDASLAEQTCSVSDLPDTIKFFGRPNGAALQRFLNDPEPFIQSRFSRPSSVSETTTSSVCEFDADSILSRLVSVKSDETGLQILAMSDGRPMLFESKTPEEGLPSDKEEKLKATAQMLAERREGELLSLPASDEEKMLIPLVRKTVAYLEGKTVAKSDESAAPGRPCFLFQKEFQKSVASAAFASLRKETEETGDSLNQLLLKHCTEEDKSFVDPADEFSKNFGVGIGKYLFYPYQGSERHVMEYRQCNILSRILGVRHDTNEESLTVFVFDKASPPSESAKNGLFGSGNLRQIVFDKEKIGERKIPAYPAGQVLLAADLLYFDSCAVENKNLWKTPFRSEELTMRILSSVFDMIYDRNDVDKDVIAEEAGHAIIHSRKNEEGTELDSASFDPTAEEESGKEFAELFAAPIKTFLEKIKQRNASVEVSL